MNKMRIGLKAIVAISIIAAILIVAPAIGRFAPSHKIKQDVYCGTCHPEQVVELGETTHLADFAKGFNSTVVGLGGDQPSAAMSITAGCTMCHNFWDNMKGLGVVNLSMRIVDTDNPAPVTDIYGNTVSPYGLASTNEYQVNYSNVVPWTDGLGSFINTTSNVSRVDYLWSLLSSVSPGPVVYTNTSSKSSCGTAEKGLCHVATMGVALGELDKLPEFPNQTAVPSAGARVFFRHEMAYTTAQYAAKPVKLCGACHVLKLPPMTWGGEPVAGQLIKNAQINPDGTFTTSVADPFGLKNTYNFAFVTSQLGAVSIDNPHAVRGNPGQTDWNNFTVLYKTPDWAHQNVPCIRCHAHAGINGETVSDNTPSYQRTNSPPPSDNTVTVGNGIPAADVGTNSTT